MTITIGEVNQTRTRVFMGTLTDHADVHQAFSEIAKKHHIMAATFELLGGCHQMTFTAYDFVNQTRHPPLKQSGPLEIVGGHGTISTLDGVPHVHWHAVVVSRTKAGVEILGGHVAEASAFALEFTLTAYTGQLVERQLHEGTGLKLWKLAPL